MKSLKVLMVSLLSPVLMFSQAGLQAHVVTEVPDFYLLEEQNGESGEETVRVRACFSESIPSNLDHSASESGISTLGIDCPKVVEVDYRDLNQFIMGLVADEGESSEQEKVACTGFALCLQFMTGLATVLGSGLAGVFGVIDFFEYRTFGETTFFPKKRTSMIAIASALPVIALGMLLSVNAENASNNLVSFRRGHDSGQDLVEEFRSGVVRGSEENNHQVLQQFMDFLNQHGRPVTVGS